MRRALLVVTVLVVVAGCTVPVAEDGSQSVDDDIGVVDGITYDEELSITVEDGLNETEIDLLAARSMARIEVIRGLDFVERTEIDVRTREEYLESRSGGTVDNVSRFWENQVWEAMFIVGQDRDVTAVFDQTLGVSVQGYYSPSEERVVIVTDNNETTISKRTLVHELVHALQDQQFGLESHPEQQDASLARDGVVEGEASLIPDLYFDRCGSEWSCIDLPESGGGDSEVDPGIILVLLQPYQEGPEFVEAIRDRGGWETVDQLYDEYPDSAAQIIDPDKYPDTPPVAVSVADRSTDEWRRLDHDPVGETVGQVGLYAMLWRNEIITVDDVYDYSHEVVDGWAGDQLVPYANDANETGYVWEIEWESAGDAAEFYDAYRDLLSEKDARERGKDRYVIRDGPFQGAFEVVKSGSTVTIVSGPTFDSLDQIHD